MPMIELDAKDSDQPAPEQRGDKNILWLRVSVSYASRGHVDNKAFLWCLGAVMFLGGFAYATSRPQIGGPAFSGRDCARLWCP